MKQLLGRIYRHPYIFNFSVGSLVILLMVLFSADIEERDNRGRTVLYLAAEQGDVSEVKQLIKRGAVIDARDDCKWTPFMRAAQKGHLAVVKVLQDAGANINAVDKNGYTALMATVINYQPEMFSYLLEQSVELNARDTTTGWTALIWAVKDGRINMARQLLDKGADFTLKDTDGKTAHDWAVEKNREEIISLLSRA